MNDINIKPASPADSIGFSALEKTSRKGPAENLKPQEKQIAQADDGDVFVPGEPLEKIAAILDKFVPEALPNTRLRIDQDNTTGMFLYQSIDKHSGEVVGQWPSDEIVRFISFYREKEGVVIDKSI